MGAQSSVSKTSLYRFLYWCKVAERESQILNEWQKNDVRFLEM
jgi:hypothetical protein